MVIHLYTVHENSCKKVCIWYSRVVVCDNDKHLVNLEQWHIMMIYLLIVLFSANTYANKQELHYINLTPLMLHGIPLYIIVICLVVSINNSAVINDCWIRRMIVTGPIKIAKETQTSSTSGTAATKARAREKRPAWWFLGTSFRSRNNQTNPAIYHPTR